MTPAFQELTWTSDVTMRLLGYVLLVIMAFLGLAVAVPVWLRTPLLICHVPPTKDQAELGVFEGNVSWNRTEEPVMTIVLLAVPVLPYSSVADTVTAYVPANAYV